MIETECLWNRNISRKKPVLKHGSYPAFTKHGSITDRAVLEHLSLNSTSDKGYLRTDWPGKHNLYCLFCKGLILPEQLVTQERAERNFW